MQHIESDIAAAEREMDDDSESIITNERYIYIASIIKGCCKRKIREVLPYRIKLIRSLPTVFLRCRFLQSLCLSYIMYL